MGGTSLPWGVASWLVLATCWVSLASAPDPAAAQDQAEWVTLDAPDIGLALQHPATWSAYPRFPGDPSLGRFVSLFVGGITISIQLVHSEPDPPPPGVSLPYVPPYQGEDPIAYLQQYVQTLDQTNRGATDIEVQGYEEVGDIFGQPAAQVMADYTDFGVRMTDRATAIQSHGRLYLVRVNAMKEHLEQGPAEEMLQVFRSLRFSESLGRR